MSFDIHFAIALFWQCLAAARITLLITVVSLLAGLPLAFLVAIIRLKKILILNQIAQIYISFIRGTPMMIQIYIIYYMVPGLLASLIKTLGIPINVYDVNALLYAYIVFGLHTAAYLSEVIRAALATVEKGQKEAALASGLSSWQAYKRIILPQAFVVAIPNICTNTIGLLKGTSLVFAMAIKDITATARVEAHENYKFVEAYVDILIIYIIICYSTEKLFKIAEKKISNYKAA
jgi:L-cystine transport system permease protein